MLSAGPAIVSPHAFDSSIHHIQKPYWSEDGFFGDIFLKTDFECVAGDGLMLGGGDGHCWRGVDGHCQQGWGRSRWDGIKSWSLLVTAFMSPYECDERIRTESRPLGTTWTKWYGNSMDFTNECVTVCSDAITKRNGGTTKLCCDLHVWRQREINDSKRRIGVRMMKEKFSVWWSDRKFGQSTGRSLNLMMALYSVRFFFFPFSLAGGRTDGRMDGVSQHTHTHARS